MSNDPIPIRLKAKYLTRHGGKAIKSTKGGNSGTPNKGTHGSWTHCAPGHGDGKVARHK
jgi:hypothetical protein